MNKNKLRKNKKVLIAIAIILIAICMTIYYSSSKPILKEGKIYECIIEVNGAKNATDGYTREYATAEYSAEISEILSKYEYSMVQDRVPFFRSEVEYYISCTSFTDGIDVAHILLGEDGYNIVNDGTNHYRIINHEELRAEIDSLLNNYD
ncbi:MAG: hypothetical protein R3Y65_05630 [Bacillota bacterium]